MALLALAATVGFLELRLRKLTTVTKATGAHVFTGSYANDLLATVKIHPPREVTRALRHLLRYPVGVNATGTPVTAELLAEIRRHPTVRALTIANNPGFGDAELAGLAPLPSLEVLVLPRTGVTDASAETLLQFSGLRRLHLDHCDVSDATLEAITPLTGLEHLELEGTRITPASLPALTAFPRLSYLDLSYTAADDTVATAIAPLRSLTFLNLGHTKVTAALEPSFPPLPRLRMLIVTGTTFPSRVSPEFRNRVPALDKIDLP